MHESYKYLQDLIEGYKLELFHGGPEVPEEIQAAIIYLNENIFDESLTVKEVANKYSNGSKNFAGKFKLHTGYYPKKYVVFHRINISKRLLKQDGISIIQIALSIGFSSHSSFCKTFKYTVGLTPSDWKKINT